MARFSWAESPGTAKATEIRVASSRFGDGYEQRGPDGLNPIKRTWSLQFKAVTLANGNAIEAFLEARANAAAGLESFQWWPMWSAADRRVVCRTFGRSALDDLDQSDISATFEEVYEP